MEELNVEELFAVFDEPITINEIQKENAGKRRTCETETEAKKLKVFNILAGIDPEEFSSHIKVHVVDTVEACLHEVAVPHEHSYAPLRDSQNPPARKYPFTLDPFQKEAILCLENNQSVLVSAHTSAGKTVVAEYAIAQSLRDKQRVIYTTPIKALSNQKYREFCKEFQDVGLLTGDVTINPSASCLIVTTEILRNMLYRGSEITREVGWVVFDEIHYMRDKERGVVWEEAIILLPDNVHYVFLSATIPNARQFAEWICQLHHQPCHVVYTDYRPVPLQQYIFPAGGDGLHLVVDERGNFLEENFNTAMTVLQVTGGASKGDTRGRKGGFKDDSNCFKVIEIIMKRKFSPFIVFSFSKKKCEAYAMQMMKLDFNSADEKPLVEEIFKNAMDRLSDEDKNLPQVEHILPLLKCGIGFHHSGLLPILKEVTEILFSEGLIKALFATETFAMGLNMPARTVLFTDARKFDGKNFRWVTSGEYIQMSGRAGRRGLDKKGIVILMIDEKMSPSAGKDIVKGLPEPINSAFHFTYNMVLNLLRTDEINPEYMLKRSFLHFQNYSAVPQLYKKIENLQKIHNSFNIESEEDVESYFILTKHLDSLSDEYHSFIIKPENCIRYLQPGRLIKVQNGEQDFGWGMYFKHRKVSTGSGKDKSTIYIVEGLVEVPLEGSSSETKEINAVKPSAPGERSIMQMVRLKWTLIQQLSSVCVKTPRDLRYSDDRMFMLRLIQTIRREKFPEGLPLLDPVEDMKIKDQALIDLIEKIEAFKGRLKENPLYDHPSVEDLVGKYKKKLEIESELKEAAAELKRARSLLQLEELKSKKRVLRRMKYCSASDVIEIKGRVACEINSADELLLIELMYDGAFNNLTVHQTAALLSCFVFQEKSNKIPKLTEELSGPLRIMQDSARRIATISKESRLEVDSDEYVNSLKPHLMDVVHSWSKGASFLQICQMTDVFEGSIIRCIRRLEVLMHQMCLAAKAIGNTDMENKFSEGIMLIKRDLPFAESLYL